MDAAVFLFQGQPCLQFWENRAAGALPDLIMGVAQGKPVIGELDDAVDLRSEPGWSFELRSVSIDVVELVHRGTPEVHPRRGDAESPRMSRRGRWPR